MTLYPLLFRPILKRRIWGGRGLARLGKPLPDDEPIGESWEIADLPPQVDEGQSIVTNGPLAGSTLREVIEAHGEGLLGEKWRDRNAEGTHSAPVDSASKNTVRFPLLIKYLDARENLSVQVHPDRAYADRHPGAHVKDEAWIIIDREPGAVIYKGLSSDISPDELRKHIASGEIISDLNAIEVNPGECHYLRSGTVHALGAGVMVAEVQTPSDTTFRMYDWGRTSRQLHVDEALEVVAGHPAPALAAGRTERGPQPHMIVDHIRTTHLLEAEAFAIERIDALADGPVDILTSNMPEVWMVLEGEGEIPGEVPVMMSKGSTVLIPASMPESEAALRAGAALLRVTLPSPLKGVIA